MPVHQEFKRLGLYLKDGAGRLITVDDPKLDPAWARCGELGMPVSIHVADPQAFWRPYDATNERWEERLILGSSGNEPPPTDEQAIEYFAKHWRWRGWGGRFEAVVRVDEPRKVWTTELRIPFAALGAGPPKPGERWRLNLYRHNVADAVFLTWSPTAAATAHTPERFGWIEFIE